MATGKRTNWRSRSVWVLAALLAFAVIALGWLLPPLKARAEVGAAYGARLACSCRFVAGRPLAQCRGDFEPGMAMIALSEDPAAKSVTARFPLLASDTARFTPGAGCSLAPWPR